MFIEEKPPFSEDEKNYLKLLAASTVITVVITEALSFAKTEASSWLARRREAKKAKEAGTP